MSHLGATLVWCVIQITILATFAIVVYAVASKLSAGARRTIPIVTLGMVVLLTLAAFLPIPSWFEPRDSDASLAHTHDAVEEPTENEQMTEQTDTSPNNPGGETIADSPLLFEFGRAFVEEFSTADAAFEESKAGWRWSWIVAVVILVGAAFGTLQWIFGLVSVAWYRRSSEPLNEKSISELLDLVRAELGCVTPVELRVAKSLSTAATVGHWRPLILLPPEWEAWSVDERRAVIAHEVAHIRRADFFFNIFAQFGLAIHFYHPLVHWIVARIRLEQEIGADALAASISGGKRPYLQTLASLALHQPQRSVGWPAHGFLPTRTMFLRRIEMLRHVRTQEPSSRSLVWRTIALALVAGTTFAVSGLRGPALTAQVAVADDNTEGASAPSDGGFNWKYISDDGGAVIAIRPAEILRQPDMGEVVSIFEQMDPMLRSVGVRAIDVKQFVTVIPLGADNVDQMVIEVERQAEIDTAVLKKVFGSDKEKEYRDQTYLISSIPGKAVWRPGDHVVVVADEADIRRFIDGYPAEQKLLGPSLPEGLKKSQVIVAVNRFQLRSIAAGAESPEVTQVLGPIASAAGPLLEKTERIYVSGTFDDGLTLQAIADCDDEESAKQVKRTLEASGVLARNLITGARMQIDRLPAGDERRLAESLTTSGLALLDRLEVVAKQKRVTAQTAGDVEVLRTGVLLPAATAAQIAAKRTQSMNNLKHIAVAYHNFHTVHNRFPNARNLSDRTQRPDSSKFPHSWRVAILPYIGQSDLYDRYHFDEPWDSKHNMTLLDQMPDFYRHPSQPNESTETCYFVVTGAETIFNGEKIELRNILDGTSNTMLAVEAKRRIPWTKPEDISYKADAPLPTFGGFHDEGFNAALADGSVHFISKNIAEEVLRALITARGSEPRPLLK